MKTIFKVNAAKVKDVPKVNKNNRLCTSKSQDKILNTNLILVVKNKLHFHENEKGVTGKKTFHKADKTIINIVFIVLFNFLYLSSYI